MRFNRIKSPYRRVIVSACVAGVLLVRIGITEEGRGFYCTRCGLTRGEHRVTWFGLPTRRSVSEHETEFHRLHARFASARCHHAWRHYTHNYWSLLGGGVGCGHFPRVLTSYDEQALRPLARVTVRSRGAAVLASFDLNRDEPEKRRETIFAAIAELERLWGPAQEERWWRRHQRLFVPAATANASSSDAARPQRKARRG